MYRLCSLQVHRCFSTFPVNAPLKGQNSQLLENLHALSVESIIKEHKLDALKAFCQHSGLDTSGTKPILAQRLLSARPVDTTATNIISVDLGTSNFAYTHILKGEIVNWGRVALGLPEPYCPKSWSLHLSSFLSDWLSRLTRNIPASEEKSFSSDDFIFLVERQRHRTSSQIFIIEAIIKVLFVEAMFHSLLLGRCIPLSPQKVATKFGLDPGKIKKKQSVALVHQWLDAATTTNRDPNSSLQTYIDMNGNEQTVNVKWRQDVIEALNTEDKQDDMCDSLLQALAFIEWQKYLTNIQKKHFFINKII